MNVILLSTLQSFSSPRERQRNSGTMMQKSSQTNPIKKHTQNLSFDKFDRIRINFVHMKSISVEASREKKNDTGHKLEVEWLLLSFFYWKSEEILKASHSNDKKMHRNRIWAVIRRLQNEYMDTWLCPLFALSWRNLCGIERKKRQTNEQNISRLSKTFYNFISFYLCSGCISTHLPASMLIRLSLSVYCTSCSPLLVLLCAHMKSVYGNGSWYVWLFACVLPFEYVHASNIFATSPLTAWCWKYEMEWVYGVVMHKCAHKWYLFENVVGDAIFKVFQFYKVILSSVMLVIPAASLYDT